MIADAAVWNAWTTATPVVVAPAKRPHFVRVRLPVAIDPGPDGAYADLRVVDDRGGETPYALDPQRQEPAFHGVRIVDTGFVPNRYSQAVLDLGDAAHADTVKVEVDTAKRPTYFERVTVEASDDRATWRIVRDGAIVYRVADDNGRGNQTITFPESYARWLRLRVTDPHEPFPVAGALAADSQRGQPAPPPLVPVPFQPASATDAAQHRQVWTFDLQPAALRPSAVTFTDGGATFARHAIIESSDDGTTWTPVADGDITRFAQGGAQTSFAFGESSARYWRVAVENGDDAPVPGLHPTLLMRPHDVVFEAMPQRTYRLLSRNDAVGTPSYDLAARLGHSTWRADAAQTGNTVPNAPVAAARPLLERSPGALTAVLVAVAVVLGALALYTVRGGKSG